MLLLIGILIHSARSRAVLIPGDEAFGVDGALREGLLEGGIREGDILTSAVLGGREEKPSHDAENHNIVESRLHQKQGYELLNGSERPGGCWSAFAFTGNLFHYLVDEAFSQGW